MNMTLTLENIKKIIQNKDKIEGVIEETKITIIMNRIKDKQGAIEEIETTIIIEITIEGDKITTERKIRTEKEMDENKEEEMDKDHREMKQTITEIVKETRFSPAAPKPKIIKKNHKYLI